MKYGIGAELRLENISNRSSSDNSGNNIRTTAMCDRRPLYISKRKEEPVLQMDETHGVCQSRRNSASSSFGGNFETLCENSDVETDDVITMNVGGVKHQCNAALFFARPVGRLARTVLQNIANGILSAPNSPTPKELFFDRDPRFFPAILQFYRSGRLHINKTFCALQWKDEMEFWELGEDAVSDCCWRRFSDLLEEQAIQYQVDQQLRQTCPDTAPGLDESPAPCTGYRQLWLTLEDPHHSTAAKVCSVAYATLVLLGIIMFISRSYCHPRALLQERCKSQGQGSGEFVTSHNGARSTNDTGDEFSKMFGPMAFNHKDQHPPNDEFPYESYTHNQSRSINATKNQDNFRRIGTHKTESNEHQKDSREREKSLGDRNTSSNSTTLENNSVGSDNSIGNVLANGRRNISNRGRPISASINPRNASTSGKIELLSGKNFSDVLLESLADANSEVSGSSSGRQVSDVSYPSYCHHRFRFVEIIFEINSAAMLSIWVMLRISSCPNKKHFMKSPLNAIDLIYLLMAWGSLFWTVRYGPFSRKPCTPTSVDCVIVFFHVKMVVGSLRVFRIVRCFRGVKELWLAIRTSFSEVRLLIIFVAIGVVVFGSLFYCAELIHGKPVDNVLLAYWWAVITMTTVGYGDVVPTSSTGYLVGCACAMVGLITVALPIPIIAHNFKLYYGFRCRKKEADSLKWLKLRSSIVLKRSRSTRSESCPAVQILRYSNDKGT